MFDNSASIKISQLNHFSSFLKGGKGSVIVMRENRDKLDDDL